VFLRAHRVLGRRRVSMLIGLLTRMDAEQLRLSVLLSCQSVTHIQTEHHARMYLLLVFGCNRRCGYRPISGYLSSLEIFQLLLDVVNRLHSLLVLFSFI
jgi:hypothetical protein